jgi:hypothetical protein
MPKSERSILNAIVAFIRSEGGPFDTWYSGITSDIQSRLFGDHGVPEKDHWYIYRRAESSTSARKIELALLFKYGTDGDPGCVDEDTTFVYSYKKTSVTNP